MLCGVWAPQASAQVELGRSGDCRHLALQHQREVSPKPVSRRCVRERGRSGLRLARQQHPVCGAAGRLDQMQHIVNTSAVSMAHPHLILAQLQTHRIRTQVDTGIDLDQETCTAALPLQGLGHSQQCRLGRSCRQTGPGGERWPATASSAGLSHPQACWPLPWPSPC